jgi:EAL domain-containing protein (putative c-di-GMP-specific phosphodiesterase class I)
MIQGYFISRPLAFDDVRAFLRASDPARTAAE